MISRAQRILFAVMLIAAVTMAVILIRMRERANDRLGSVQDSAPLVQPADTPLENVSLLIPNDMDGSLLPAQRSLPLPADESARARVLVATLLESFRDPKSTHPIQGPIQSAPDGGVGIDEVYLMPIPQPKGAPPVPGKMAVVDFSSVFAGVHPSGIEPETLTLLAIIGTLHANLPEITQVRFLVDGRQVPTLAGHADLTRTYLASETEPTR